ncbi:o-succinylbenzoate--CoA ligase [Melioribacteraceae bacterium 4301-Me]|uniref:o-succinylbenzoate--CoA ligase n=1 Tax=Pyranulibacter aquaticus TaxID=3163344 RepID=UPI00359B214C
MINITNNKFWLEEQAKLAANNIAVATNSKNLTYKELLAKVNKVCTFLREIKISHNDKVALLYENNLDFILITLALWKINAVPVPMNIRLTINELKTQLDFLGPKYVLIQPKLFASFEKFPNSIEFKADENSPLRGLYNRLNEKKSPLVFNKTNTALIMFTSGSSGRPKAVVHTFESLYNSAKASDSIINLQPDDKFLASLPFYHIGGFMIFVRTLLAGSTVVLPKSFSSNVLLRYINKFGVNYLSIVGKTLKEFVERKVSLPKSLKYLFVGGGPVDENLCLDAVKKGWPVIKVYGSTETCSMCTAILPNDILLKPSSSGKPLLKNRIVIKKYNPSEAYGEIVVKSNSLFKEYYKNKKLTQIKLQNKFYFTGDYGYVDEDGYVYIKFKREDLIVTGGENVDPNEVKTAIEKINCVKETYVFGIDDKKWGQKICAAVVLKRNSTITQEELKTLLRKKLAGYKIPKEIFFLKKLPKTELGKVIKTELLNLAILKIV